MDKGLTQIGKYTLIKQLGSGGFGAVYLAEDPKLHQQLAIKVFQLKDVAIAHLYSTAVLVYRMLTGTLPVGRFQDPSHN